MILLALISSRVLAEPAHQRLHGIHTVDPEPCAVCALRGEGAIEAQLGGFLQAGFGAADRAHIA